jgi:diguanylate cyclase (GGDEF)-like protein
VPTGPEDSSRALDSIATILWRCPLFKELGDGALEDISQRAVIRNFLRGEVIVGQGDAMAFLLVVSDGLLKTYITSPSGSHMILDLVRPGDSVGLDLCMGDGLSQASVEAIADTQVVVLSSADLNVLVQNHPSLLTSMTSAMSNLIQRRTSQVTDLVFLELHQRIAKLLLGLLPAKAAAGDAGEQAVVTLRLSLTDLAAVVGGHPDAVREAVLTFQQLGYIELLGGRGIAIRQPDSLRDHLAKGGSWAQLTKQTFHDVLTGLPNRAFFRMRASSVMARYKDTGQAGAVLFVDLDDFKKINDTMGHAAGDELLTQVVERLRISIRPSDTPARLGGDEFAILLEDMRSVENASVVAQRVVNSIGEPFALAAGLARVQASVGVAVFEGEHDLSLDAVIEHADKAMYAAKQAGKGRVVVFADGVEGG